MAKTDFLREANAAINVLMEVATTSCSHPSWRQKYADAVHLLMTATLLIESLEWPPNAYMPKEGKDE